MQSASACSNTTHASPSTTLNRQRECTVWRKLEDKHVYLIESCLRRVCNMFEVLIAAMLKGGVKWQREG